MRAEQEQFTQIIVLFTADCHLLMSPVPLLQSQILP